MERVTGEKPGRYPGASGARERVCRNLYKCEAFVAALEARRGRVVGSVFSGSHLPPPAGFAGTRPFSELYCRIAGAGS